MVVARKRRIIYGIGPGQMDIFSNEYTDDVFTYGHLPIQIKHGSNPSKQMQRPFIAWDGEGYTDEHGFHHYWLLGNSLGSTLIATPGYSLGRINIARMFQDVLREYPNSINVGFSLGYDFTCILRSNGLSAKGQASLKSSNKLWDAGYLWKLMQGKQLTVAEHWDKRESKTFTLYDTWGFFQRSFVAALDLHFPDGWEKREAIISMKERRNTFDRSNDDEVIDYNKQELKLMVLMMEDLRDKAYAAGMPLSAWYGPGAWAAGLLRTHKIKKAVGPNLYETNVPVATAAMHAYAGGRFECFKVGRAGTAVIQNDINSAYPYAISQLPDLSNGRWVHGWHNPGDPIPGKETFTVYRMNFDTQLNEMTKVKGYDYPRSIPFPLWRRDPHGNISYPATGIHGWYWDVEVEAAQKWCETDFGKKVGATLRIQESWSFVPNSDGKPFQWVEELYRHRQILKKLGNGAQIAIRLALNSLYGKLAQQIGWLESGNIPPFHNLAMAGWVTAKCRSMLLEACLDNLQEVIAFETDAVFSSATLPITVSSKLGEWDSTSYADLYYFQSGFRFGIDGAGDILKPATRGIKAADVSLAAILAAIRDNESRISVESSRFYTLRWALHLGDPSKIGQWETMTKEMRMMQEDPRGKRVHDPFCSECEPASDGKRTYRWERMHQTIPFQGYEGSLSCPHPVEWVAGNELFAEHRLTDNEDDGEVLF